MPVMQYIHENKDFPLLVEIFPNYDGESASFELNEDDGETQDYLKDVFSKTKFAAITEKVNFKASKIEWAWNEESRECMIILPDNRKEIKIKLSLAK